MEFGEDVISILCEVLGISPNLCGKDHRNMGKFQGRQFYSHLPPPVPQFLSDGGQGEWLFAAGQQRASLIGCSL